MQYFIWDGSKVRNLLLTMAYDGQNYHGWQVQKNARTVQEVFQDAVKKVIGVRGDVKGCSRTDSGVHANMYCVSMKVESNIPCERLVQGLNRHMPRDIAVQSAVEVPIDFHARYSCIGKEYIYKIWNSKVRNPFLDGYAFHYWYELNDKLLNAAGQAFVGRHDFSSFCTLDCRNAGNMVREVKKFEVFRADELVTMKVMADGFLYNMVRIIVGTLLSICAGRIDPSSISDIIQARDRSKAGPTAVASGLYLNKVFYRSFDSI